MCTADNEQAKQMVRNSNMGIGLNNSDHTYLPTWGCQRCDLNFLETKMGDKPHAKALAKTWMYLHSMSPNQVVHGLCMNETVKCEGNLKFSLDLNIWRHR